MFILIGTSTKLPLPGSSANRGTSPRSIFFCHFTTYVRKKSVGTLNLLMMQLKGQLQFNKRSSSLMCSTCSSPSASRPLFSRMSPPRRGGLLTSLLGSQPRFNAESSSSSSRSPSSSGTLRRSTYVCNSAQLCMYCLTKRLWYTDQSITYKSLLFSY